MQNSKASQNNNKNANKKTMRPQSQRLVLEPRIVFDAALPIAGADFIDAAHAAHDASAPDTHIEAPAVAATVFASQPPVASDESEHENAAESQTTNPGAVQNESAETVSEHKAYDNSTDGDLAPIATAPAEIHIAADTPTETALVDVVVERPLIDGTLAPANLTSHEIIFIDAIVADLQQYITDHPNADVVLLDSTKDALDQIAATLSGRTDISAIHILSHGASGELQIGNGILNLQNLTSGSHASDLAIIKSALTENGDILIYGCNVSAGANGQAFIDALAANTGADIAASLNTTGAAEAFGGDWQLETQTGTIEAKNLQLADWQNQLAVTNTGAGTAWTFNAAANTAAVPVTATNTTDGITTTVTLSSATANAWSGTAVQTLNNIAAFSNGAQNTADFTTTFNTASTAGVTGTVTITFSKPIINPVIHIDRIGGISGTSNSSVWTLATAGATLTKLAGSSSLAVTGTTIQRTTGVTTTGTESSLTDALGTAAGSVQVNGTYSTITFNVTGPGDGLELAFALDAPPIATNDTFVSVSNATVTGNIVTGNNGAGVDSDVRGDALSITKINGVNYTVGSPIALANGTLTISAATGAFTFVPNPGFATAQAFTYTIADPIGNTSTATVTINADTDGDGVINSNDLDDDNDGILDTVETSVDTDGDGIINSLDLDSDNDGISDLFESKGAATAADANNDGTVSLAENGDTNSDGLMNIFGAGTTPINTDGDAVADYLDLDSDNDGIADTVEARLTAGYVANDGNVTNNDADKDGIIDLFDTNDGTTKLFGGSFVNPVNTDGADLVDYLDTDSDNDGKLDSAESGLSTVTTDANGDGIRDSVNASYADPDGLVNAPQTNLANEVGTTLEVAYREVNKAPIIDLNSAATLGDTTRDNTATYTENGAAVKVATLTAGTTDNGDLDLTSMTIKLTSGFANGANEVINIGGFNFASNANSTQAVTVGGTTFNIAYSTATGFTITRQGGGVIAPVDMDTLVRDITYANTSENPTAGARLLTFALIDAAGLISPPAVATITVVATNDAPTVVAPATLSTVEDTPLAITGITFADIDASGSSVTVILSVNSGTLAWATTPFIGASGSGTGTVTLTGQITAINNAIAAAKLTYTPLADFNNSLGGTATLTSSINDNGNTGTGGALTGSATTTIQVTPVADIVNDAVTTSEDTAIVFNAITGTNGASADNFENVGRTVTAVTQGAHGTVSFAADGTLTYTPALDYAGPDTFTYTVTSGGVTETATVTVTVNPVNDAPAGTDKTITATEDTPISLTVADFGFTDPKDTPANAFANVIITTLPTTGVLKLSGVAVTAGQVISVANIPNLTWTPALNSAGTAVSAFTFQVQDNGATGGLNQNTDQSPNTITFNVNAVNDAPVNSVPATQTAFEDTPKAITGLSINDVDAATGSMTVTLSITNGTLTVTGGTAAIVGSGTTTVTLTGTQAQINATLASTVTYVPTTNFNGVATLTMVTDDGGNTGTDPGLTGTATSEADTDTVIINVTPVNDAPTGTNLTGAATEDTPYTVTVANFGFADANDTPANAFTNIIISGALPLASEGVYQLNGVAITNGQVISVADINSGLLKFVPAPNFNGNGVAALIFKVQDNGGTANAGVDTSVATNTFTLNIAPVDDVVNFTNLNNGLIPGTDAQVKESDLSTGSDPAGTAETTTSTFNMGPDSALANTGTVLTIDGAGAGIANITKAQLAAATVGAPITIVGSNGTLSITGYNPVNGAITYSYTLSSAANHTGNITVNDSFSLVATDAEGTTTAPVNLAINIIDDAPIAIADVDEVINVGGNPSSTASGNVFSGIGGTDPNTTDGVADKIGADTNASPVTGVVAGIGAPIGSNVGAAVASALGSLTLNADGSYVYTPNYANPAVSGLLPGQTVTDTYTYQITDGDGDTATTTLTITIVGVPAVVGLNDGTVAGTDGSVFESDLAAGTNAAGTGEALNGSFQLVSPSFGVGSLTIAGTTFSQAQLLTLGTTPVTITTANGTLTLNSYTYNALTGTGTVGYLYTLVTPATSAANATDNFSVTMQDGAGNNTPTKTLSIAIIDDAPIATADVASVTESGTAGAGTPSVTLNVFTNDKIGADGSSTAPVGPVTGLVAGTGAPASGVGVGSAVAGSYGSVTIGANGAYTYTLNNASAAVNALKVGQTLTETYTYQITDKDGDTATATLTITINGANDAPVAADNTYSMTEDAAAITLTPLVGDTDPDGDTLTITNIAGTAIVAGTAYPSIAVTGGTVSVTAGGVITFTPALNFNGTATFAYTVSDGNGGTSTANQIINVAAVNDAPIANPDVNTTPEEQTLIVPAATGLLTNDNDTADANLALSVTQFVVSGTTVTVPAGAVGGSTTIAGVGTITIKADGSYTFAPVLNFNGPVPIITYTVDDGSGAPNATATSTLSLSVTPVNDAPAAVADTASVTEAGAANAGTPTATGNVLLNDTDVDSGDTKTVSAVNGVAGNVGNLIIGTYGDITINADGSYTYTLDNTRPATQALAQGAVVTESFAYTMSDTAGATSASNITVTVNGANDAPVAVVDTGSTPEDTPLVVNAAAGVLANDTDVDTGATKTVTQFTVNGVAGTFAAGSTATITGVGTLVINADGSYTFTPALNFNGAVPVATYTVSDGTATATSTLTLSVAPVNDAPIANPDTATTLEEAPVSGNILANDTDVDTGTTLTVTQFTIAGMAGTFTVPPAGSTTQTITNGAVTVGSITISSNGDYTFTPALNFNGAVPVITYTANDGSGVVSTNTATSTLTITVTPVNDPPVAVDDGTVALPLPIVEDTPTPLNLLGNDTDADLDTLSVKSINGTTLTPGTAQSIPVPNGTVNVSAAGVISFTPALNYNGPVTFDYVVQDSKGGEDTGTVNLNVTPVNDAPIALPDIATTPEETPVSGNVLANDSDVDVPTTLTVSTFTFVGAVGGPFAAGSTVTIPLVGDITINSDGTYTFSPVLNFNGTVPVITYTADDGSGAGNAATSSTLSITVTPVNDPPIATPVTPSGAEDTPIAVSLAGTDIEDITPNIVTVTSLPQATQGVLYLADGITPVTANTPLTALQAAGLIFKPALNFNGTVTIPFTVTDSNGTTSAPATAVITVNPVNDAPVANPDTATTLEDNLVSGNVLTNDSDVDIGSVLTVASATVDLDGNGTQDPLSIGVTTTINVAGNPIGTILLNNDGSYTFTPALNFNGAVPTITYLATDNGTDNGSTVPPAKTASSTLNITVTPVNDVPLATAATTATPTEDGPPVAVPLTGTDVDGTVDFVTILSGPSAAQGTLTYDDDGLPGTPPVAVPLNTPLTPAQAATVKFTPAANYFGPVDPVTFKMTDNSGALSATATVTIPSIVNINDAPVAISSGVTTPQDTPVAINLLGTDVDDATNTLTVKVLTISAGTLFLADGTTPVLAGATISVAQATGMIFKPVVDLNDGTYTVTFEVTDPGTLTSSIGTFTILENATDDPPVATNIVVPATEDTVATINLTAQGSDPDIGDSIAFVTVTTLPPASEGVLYKANGITPVVAGTPLTALEAASLKFAPVANFNGTVTTFNFTVTDTTNLVSNVATISINIAAVNDAPVANPDTATTLEDNPVSGNVLTNDSDVDIGSVITVASATVDLDGNGIQDPLPIGVTTTINVAGNPIGTILLNSDGTYTFTPALNFNGTVPTITYTATDNGTDNGNVVPALTAASTLKITVTPDNDPPVANLDTYSTNEDTPTAALNLLANDTDVDGDTLSIKSINGTALTPGNAQSINVPSGVVNVTAAGVITFTPAPNFNGPATFSYVVQDGNGGEAPGTVNINVAPVNDAPIVAPDTATTPEEVAVSGNVLGNDSDVDIGTALTVTQFMVGGTTVIVDPVLGGSITIASGIISMSSNGNYTFTPALNFNGAVPQITYTVTDDGTDNGTAVPALTASSTLDITVTPVNDPPIATPTTATGAEDAASITVSLAGTDIEDGVPNIVTVTTLPPATQGVLYLAGGTVPVVAGAQLTAAQAAGLVFVPALNFNGTVTIPFTVTDSEGITSAAANAVITVTSVNDAPIATPTTATTAEETPVTVSLGGTDVDGTIASITVTTLPTTEGVLYYADGITPVSTTTPLTALEAAGLVFKPALNFYGTVTITFTVLDNQGLVSAAPANAVITVTSVNDAPTANPDIAPVTIVESGVNPGNTAVAGTPSATGNVLTNDTDVDAPDTKTVTIVNGTAVAGSITIVGTYGDLTINAAGAYTYTLDNTRTATQALAQGAAVSEVFNYTMQDTAGATSSSTLTVNITGTNDQPVAAADVAAVTEAGAAGGGTPTALGNVLTNDTDIDTGDTQTLTLVNGTAIAGSTVITGIYGDLTIDATGAYTYALDNTRAATQALAEGAIVTEVFNYTMKDSNNATASSTLTVTVTGANDAPVATPATTATPTEDGSPIAIPLVGTDVDGSVDFVTITAGPSTAEGTLTYDDDGNAATPPVAVPLNTPLTAVQAASVKFTPAADYFGPVTPVTFTVTDNLGAVSASADVTIPNIVNINDAPIDGNEINDVTEDTTLTVAAAAGLLANTTDVDGATPTITSFLVGSNPTPIAVSPGTPGVSVIAGVGTITISSDGSYSFVPEPNFDGLIPVITYTVNDNSGGVNATDTSTLTLNMLAVNDPPTATATSASTLEDTPVPITLTGSDIDGTIASITVTTLPPAAEGVLYLADGVTTVAAGATLTQAQATGLIFKPGLNFSGTVTIPFIVIDNSGAASAPANLVITISPVNDAPVATPTTATGNEDAPVTGINLTGTDIDGTVVSITVTALPPASQGVLYLADGVTLVPAGALLTPAEASTLVFKAAPNFNGTVTIPFTVKDNLVANSAPANVVITVNPVNDPPVATPTSALGSAEASIPIPLTGTDIDGTIAQVVIQSIPPASQGTLLLNGVPVAAGAVLTSAEAAALVFKPNPGFNGTASFMFSVIDNNGAESSFASASITVEASSVLFEQLLSPPIKFGDGFDPQEFAPRSPVIPVGMPENLFVTHSVRESQNQIAQNSALGVFNADAPTLAELNNFTFDLKGLPIGMDPNLFVQHAIHGQDLVFAPNVFVQNAVRQSQMESTARNIGVTSFNSATSGVTSLMSPFNLGSPNDAADLAIDGVQGDFAKKVEVETDNTKLAATAIEKAAESHVLADTLVPRLEEVVELPIKDVAIKQYAAASFANQLNAAAKKMKSNPFVAKN